MFGTARHGSVGVRNDSEGLMAKKNPLSHKIRDWLQDRALRVMIGGALLLPYSVRVRAGGWLFARVLAPIAGYSTKFVFIKAGISTSFRNGGYSQPRRLKTR